MRFQHLSVSLPNKKKKGKDMSRMINMDENVCDNDLVLGSCYARSCIEVPSLKAGNAKWKAFYKKFPWLKGQHFYLRRSCFWDGKERNLKEIKIKLKKI